MSNKLKPTNWQTQVRVFESAGFQLVRQAASHLVYEKEGVLRPVIIPKYSEIGLDIIKGNMRTAGLSRKDYLRILNNT